MQGTGSAVSGGALLRARGGLRRRVPAAAPDEGAAAAHAVRAAEVGDAAMAAPRAKGNYAVDGDAHPCVQRGLVTGYRRRELRHESRMVEGQFLVGL